MSVSVSVSKKIQKVLDSLAERDLAQLNLARFQKVIVPNIPRHKLRRLQNKENQLTIVYFAAQAEFKKLYDKLNKREIKQLMTIYRKVGDE